MKYESGIRDNREDILRVAYNGWAIGSDSRITNSPRDEGNSTRETPKNHDNSRDKFTNGLSANLEVTKMIGYDSENDTDHTAQGELAS